MFGVARCSAGLKAGAVRPRLREAADDFGPSRERRVRFDLGGDGGLELAQLGPNR